MIVGITTLQGKSWVVEGAPKDGETNSCYKILHIVAEKIFEVHHSRKERGRVTCVPEHNVAWWREVRE